MAGAAAKWEKSVEWQFGSMAGMDADMVFFIAVPLLFHQTMEWKYVMLYAAAFLFPSFLPSFLFLCRSSNKSGSVIGLQRRCAIN